MFHFHSSKAKQNIADSNSGSGGSAEYRLYVARSHESFLDIVFLVVGFAFLSSRRWFPSPFMLQSSPFLSRYHANVLKTVVFRGASMDCVANFDLELQKSISVLGASVLRPNTSNWSTALYCTVL